MQIIWQDVDVSDRYECVCWDYNSNQFDNESGDIGECMVWMLDRGWNYIKSEEGVIKFYKRFYNDIQEEEAKSYEKQLKQE